MRAVARALLLAFVFTIPWEYSLDLGAPFGNIARVFGLLLLVFAILAVLRARRLRTPDPLVWMTGALYLWFCCSYFWTLTPDETLTKLRGYPQEMMIVWLIGELAESPEDLRNLLGAWLAGSWLLALLTVGNFIWPDVAASDQIRFVASGQDPNDTARFLDFGFPIALLMLSRKERLHKRILAVGFFPVALAGVILTASRGGFLVALVALAGCGVMVAQRNPKGVLLGACALPIVAGILWVSAPHETFARLGTIAEQLHSGDLNQRVNIWFAGWQAFLRAPICGHGAGSFVAAARLAPIDTAHNTLLSLVVEGGLCAVALASGIVVISCRAVMRTKGDLRFVLGILMVIWLISSVVGTVGENRITWLLFGVFALSRRIRDEDPDRTQATFSLKRCLPPMPTRVLAR